MRIAELSRRSGVSIPTIKFYLREGLLPPGAATAANQADYTETHIRRLGLIRALIDVGRLSVAKAREVLAAVGVDDTSPIELLGTAQHAVIRAAPTDPDDPATRAARDDVTALLDRLGWQFDPRSPALDQAAEAVRVFRALGQDDLLSLLDTYAEAAALVAGREVAAVVARQDPDRMVEGVVIGTVLGEALLDALRLLAQQNASNRLLGPPGQPPPALGPVTKL
ncbi:MerR family transcriptional regulator [Actinoplanes sp. NPDC051411]|uniref:MerR family transcriptional regulator n=1 Tax=Actinoplanes sp. NPDC051411 TaxID=3155522 RepID=UPI003428EEE8